MDRTEIKFGKITTVARLPIKKTLVHDHERCETEQPIPSRLFAVANSS